MPHVKYFKIVYVGSYSTVVLQFQWHFAYTDLKLVKSVYVYFHSFVEIKHNQIHSFVYDIFDAFLKLLKFLVEVEDYARVVFHVQENKYIKT